MKEFDQIVDDCIAQFKIYAGYLQIVKKVIPMHKNNKGSS